MTPRKHIKELKRIKELKQELRILMPTDVATTSKHYNFSTKKNGIAEPVQLNRKSRNPSISSVILHDQTRFITLTKQLSRHFRLKITRPTIPTFCLNKARNIN